MQKPKISLEVDEDGGVQKAKDDPISLDLMDDSGSSSI